MLPLVEHNGLTECIFEDKCNQSSFTDLLTFIFQMETALQLDLPQVDSLIFLVMARYIGTVKKNAEKDRNPRKKPNKPSAEGASELQSVGPESEEIVRRTFPKSTLQQAC